MLGFGAAPLVMRILGWTAHLHRVQRVQSHRAFVVTDGTSHAFDFCLASVRVQKSRVGREQHLLPTVQLVD